MAYFSNGSKGEVFDEQCSKCKYGDKSCPIAFVQMEYNYKACNKKTTRIILDFLIERDGSCTMFKEFESDFAIDPN